MMITDNTLEAAPHNRVYTIFCPSSHLMLSSPSCPVCGWQSTEPGEFGDSLWAPVQLNTGIGKSKPDSFIKPAVKDGVAVFPLKNHEIAGMNTSDGTECWRINIGNGLVTNQVIADENNFLISISDERPFGTAGQAKLASIDIKTGTLTTLWQDEGHQISAPVLTKNNILIRTISGLVVLSRAKKPELIRRIPLHTWFDLPPLAAEKYAFIFDGNIVKNFGQLHAIDIETGSIMWSIETDGVTMQQAALSDNSIIFQNGKRKLTAVDILHGDLIWNAEFDKIYTPPVAIDQKIYCVIRDSNDEAAPAQYSLISVNAANGQSVWQTSIPAKVKIKPLPAGRNVYLASTDGRLIGFNTISQEKQFEKTIGNEQDPPASELIMHKGIIYSSSSSGLISAFRVEELQPDKMLSPEEYLRSNNFEMAGAAYALQGDFKNAAVIFANRVQDIKKALVLYDAAGMYDEAASLSFQHGFLAEAEYYYQLAGDPLNQAKMLLKRSELAPNKAVYAGQLRRAVELLNKVGQDDRELDALVKLSEVKPDKVLFERIIKLARTCARYSDEAIAWEKINNPVNAADAFRRAGVLAEQEKPQNKQLIIARFKKAAQLFSECGMDNDSYQCQNEIAMLEELPVINIKIKPLSDLKAGKWNIIGFVIQNLGYGIAQQISWRIIPGRFEVESGTGTWALKSLGIGNEKEVRINIRPNSGESGDAVPMVIAWQWNSLDGRKIHHRTNVSLKVIEQKESIFPASNTLRTKYLSKIQKSRLKRLKNKNK